MKPANSHGRRIVCNVVFFRFWRTPFARVLAETRLRVTDNYCVRDNGDPNAVKTIRCFRGTHRAALAPAVRNDRGVVIEIPYRYHEHGAEFTRRRRRVRQGKGHRGEYDGYGRLSTTLVARTRWLGERLRSRLVRRRGGGDGGGEEVFICPVGEYTADAIGPRSRQLIAKEVRTI